MSDIRGLPAGRVGRRWRPRLGCAMLGLVGACIALVQLTAEAEQEPTACVGGEFPFVNGGFEQPAVTTNGWAPVHEDLVPGWETTATDGQIEIWNGTFNATPHAEGVQHAELNANQVSTLFQEVATVPGTTVYYRVYHRGRLGIDVAQLQFGPVAGPPNFTRLMEDGNRAWGMYKGTYTIPDGQTTTRFAFESISSSGGHQGIGNLLDGVHFGTPACVITDKAVRNLAGTDPAHPGDVLEYTVTARNQGGSDATRVVIADGIPAGAEFVPGSLTIGGVAVTDARDADGGEYDARGRQVVLRVGAGASGSIGGVLPPSGAATVGFRVRVLPGADGTTITNAALTSFVDPLAGGGVRVSTSNDVGTRVLLPAVQLLKSQTGLDDRDGDLQASVGDRIEFGFTARNAGSEDLSVVTVSDPRIPTLRCGPSTALGKPFSNGGALAATDRVVCTGTMQVIQSDVDAGQATNTASVVARGVTGVEVRDDDTVTVPTAGPQPRLRLEKTASPASGAHAGGDVTFTIVATNSGNVTLKDVTVSDPSLGALACVPTTPTTLAPGRAVACTGSRKVTQAEANAGALENTAEAAGLTPTGARATAAVTTSTPTAPRVALLILDKVVAGHSDVDSNGSVSVGDRLDYEVVVTNAGNVTQTAVSISDPRLASLSCTPSQPATLAPGQSLTCRGPIDVTQDHVDQGEVVNTATAVGTPPPGIVNPPVSASIATPTEPAKPRISLVKNVQSLLDSDGSGSFTPGDVIVYAITAANTGNVALQRVMVTDPLLGVLVCDRAALPTLAPGASTTCTGTYRVTPDDANAGVRTNTASASGTDPRGGTVQTSSNTLTIPITASNPQITLTKSVIANDDTNGSGSIDPGDTLRYELLVANTGNVILSGVTIMDSLVPPTCPPPAAMMPGASFTCEYELPVTQAHQDEGEIRNTAEVTADTAAPDDPPVVDVHDSIVSTDGRRPDATLRKVVSRVDDRGDASNDVGDIASFEITLTNTGNVTLAGSRISDDRVTNLDCTPTQPAALAPGQSVVCIGHAAIAQSDQDAGVMTDHAVANTNHLAGAFTREDRAVVSPVPAQPAITTTKTARHQDRDGSGTPSVADLVAYTITAKNSGNVTIHGVSILDPRLPDLECTPAAPASLDPGQHLTCTGTGTIANADVEAGHLVNVARASGEGPSGNTVTGVGTSIMQIEAPAPGAPRSEPENDGSRARDRDPELPRTGAGANTSAATLVLAAAAAARLLRKSRPARRATGPSRVPPPTVDR